MTTEEILATNPDLKKFVDSMPARFEKGTTTCDGEGCIAQLTPTTFNVFITPDQKGMMLCVRCLHVYRIRHNLVFNQ